MRAQVSAVLPCNRYRGPAHYDGKCLILCEELSAISFDMLCRENIFGEAARRTSFERHWSGKVVSFDIWFSNGFQVVCVKIFNCMVALRDNIDAYS